MNQSTEQFFNGRTLYQQRPTKKVKLTSLFFNHMDAWVTSLIAATFALFIHQAVTPRTLLLAGAITIGYWLAFALNDYYDAPYDALDPAKAHRNFFVQVRVSKGQLWLGLLLVGLFLLYVFAQFYPLGLIILVLSFFILWAYSAPPLRLKSRPGLDLMTHAIFVQTYPYLICLILIGATWTQLDYVILILAFLTSLTAQLEQQARDFAIDSETERNFTTMIGLERSIGLGKGLTLLGVVIFFINLLNGTIPLYIGLIFFIGLPAIIHRLFRPPTQPRSERLIKTLIVISFIYILVITVYKAGF